MRRRAFMAASASVLLAGCSGRALPGISEDTEIDERIAGFGAVSHGSAVFDLLSLYVTPEVEFVNDAETIDTWGPDGESIVVAVVMVENLSDEMIDFPTYEQFELDVAGEVYAPISELPIGVDVGDIRDPTISDSSQEGVWANGQDVWDVVFQAPVDAIDELTLRWTRSDATISWTP